MSSSDLVAIEVAYALPHKQSLLRLDVPAGTTVEQAVQRSGLLEQYPEIDLATAQMGVFGKQVPASTELKSGDRVEIYRPLIADPKAARRRRAQKAKAKGDADPT
ncbi:RnfH family protein [Abyssibacter sp.]|uniref:RnfH family protein n=1 Tax=Abyssibacter sp. TaxID=2320200 RepID=UPI0025C545D3|nr:RnfH family protein [Abyssibacter sp.]MCK5860526.1 RnfH family protein [Abyssibacter sp.]